MLKSIVMCLVTVFVVSLSIPAVVNAEPNMQEGQWEIAGEMKVSVRTVYRYLRVL